MTESAQSWQSVVVFITKAVFLGALIERLIWLAGVWIQRNHPEKG